jgi:DNA-binding transcriptional MocR family regulator
MSVKAIAWALEQAVPPEQKITLVVLANFANEDNECWPSRNTIARLASVSPRSVTRYTQQLQEHGLIQAKTGALENGARSANRFRLVMERQLSLAPPSQFVQGVAPVGGTGPEPQPCPGPLANCGSTIEPSVKPSREPKTTQGALLPERPDWLPPEWDEWVEERKVWKKALTPRAAKYALQDLVELRRAGQDVSAVIRASIVKRWTTFYAIRPDRTSRMPTDRTSIAEEAARLIERNLA